MKKYIVTLAEDEREALGELTSKGKHKSLKNPRHADSAWVR